MTHIETIVEGLTDNEAVNALKALVVENLNNLGGSFLVSDAVATLTDACPSVTASKLYYIDGSAASVSSAGLQKKEFHAHDAYLASTVHPPSYQ